MEVGNLLSRMPRKKEISFENGVHFTFMIFRLDLKLGFLRGYSKEDQNAPQKHKSLHRLLTNRPQKVLLPF